MAKVQAKTGNGKARVGAYDVRIRIALKKGVADPEGNNTLKALHLLGFEGVERVSTERTVRLRVRSSDLEGARAEAERACRRLLTNPVIHDFEIDVEAGA